MNFVKQLESVFNFGETDSMPSSSTVPELNVPEIQENVPEILPELSAISKDSKTLFTIAGFEMNWVNITIIVLVLIIVGLLIYKIFFDNKSEKLTDKNENIISFILPLMFFFYS